MTTVCKTNLRIVLTMALMIVPAGAHAQYRVAMGGGHTLALHQDGTVWTWGQNGSGQLGDGSTQTRLTPSAVPGLIGIIAIAAGDTHSLALKSDGTVWAWGTGGRVGDGTGTTRTSPVQVTSLSSIAAISARKQHSIALKSDGTVWTWGDNSWGELGDGTQTSRTSPVQVSSLSSVIVAVAASAHFSLAVQFDGTVWGWGDGQFGTVGNGTTTTPRTSPAEASSIVDQVAVDGASHTSFAWDASGVLSGWGTGSSGELATGTSVLSQTTPLAITAIPNIAALRGGASHVVAARTDGTAWAWGFNAQGQVGDGTTTTRLSPVALSGPEDVESLSANLNSSIAVSDDGRVWVWGDNADGRLGDGTTTGRLTPVQISEPGFDWRVATPHFSVPSGTYTTSPTVTITVATPDAVMHYTTNGDEPTESDPTIASGASVSVIQSVTLKVKAWLTGMPSSNTGTAIYTMQVATPSISVASGTYGTAQSVTLSVTTSGADVRYTTDGSTPTASSPLYSSPVVVSTATTLNVVAFKSGWSPSATASATYGFNFGTLAAPTISPAAGQYVYGQEITLSAAGSATIRYTTDGSTPDGSSSIYMAPIVLAAPMTVKARAFHVDWTQSAVSSTAYTVKVSAPTFSPDGGSQTAGQLITVATTTVGAVIRYTTNGLDPTESDPIIVSGDTVMAGNFVLKAKAFKSGWTASDAKSATYSTTGSFVTPAVSTGQFHSAVLTPEGTVWSWGNNTQGELGDGTFNPRTVPGIVNGVTGVMAIAVGDGHTLALRSDGQVWAWGKNGSGQLGDTTTTVRSVPIIVSGLTGVVAVAAGANFSVAVKSDGTVWAWGSNSNGQIGDGTTTQRNQPTQVSGLTGVTGVAVGANHVLAQKSNGTLWAWGASSNGQVGDGSWSINRTTPVQTTVPSGEAANVSAGGSQSQAISGSGALRTWGDNSSAQGGVGYISSGYVSPTVISSFTPAAVIDSGASHVIATLADGTLWGWGNNSSGQLGDGTTTMRLVPTSISALSGVTAVAAGTSHSLAITWDGSVWAWGGNGYGQLGDGTLDQRLLPVRVSEPGFAWKVGAPRLSPPPGNYTAETTVSVTSVTAGATIRYTTTGADPTESDAQVPGGGVSITATSTLKTRAFKSGLAPSNVSAGVYTLQIPAPILSKATGTYFDVQNVVVTNAVAGVTMRYTTNGVTPTASDPVVASGGTVVIGASAVLSVKGFKSGWTDSNAASASYTLKVPSPSFTPAPGTHTGAVSLTMSVPVTGAAISYSLNGAEPSPGAVYTSPVSVTSTTTVRAVASRAGWTSSVTQVGSYVIRQGPADPPIFAPSAGTFTEPLVVRLAAAQSDAVIRFTTDGSEPTASSPRYEWPLLISSSTTFKAKSFRPDYTSSSTVTAAYALDSAGAVATPTVQPAGGQFATRQTVTLSVATAGATLRYTIDGSDPDETSATVASGGTIVVSQSQPLKVRAYQSGLDPSRIRREYYLITGAVASGAESSFAIKADGTLWAWGRNTYGQLGDGTTQNRLAPVQVSGLTDVVVVATSRSSTGHTLAVKRDGTVWAWGYNFLGQLGLGDQTQRNTPTVISGLTNVVAVAAGFSHSMALKADGTVWAWGANFYGEVGDGTLTRRYSPVQLTSLVGIKQIAAAGEASYAIQDDGAESGVLWTWGRNDRGQPGDGGLLDRVLPVRVPDLPAIRHVGAGWRVVYAIAADGSVWGWGANEQFQVSDGQPSDKKSPVPLPPIGVALTTSGGAEFGGAMTTDGTVWTWGYNNAGQLGSAPSRWYVDRIPTLSAALGLALGTRHGLAVAVAGGVSAWGSNALGELGDGSTTNRTTPVSSSSLSLVDNFWLLTDPDSDGVATWKELRAGTDPLVFDSNGDGIGDGISDLSQLPSANPDFDGDGVSNAVEIERGTDPYGADTDGDGVIDSLDAFPFDATRSQWPSASPGDSTPPVIVVTEPTDAQPVP